MSVIFIDFPETRLPNVLQQAKTCEAGYHNSESNTCLWLKKKKKKDFSVKQAVKRVRLGMITVNQTRVCDFKDFSRLYCVRKVYNIVKI